MLTITKDGQVTGEGFECALEDFGNFGLFVKKPIPIHAMEMNSPFQCEDQNGNLQPMGRPGDFLMRGVEGEYYCCPRSVFLLSYTKVR